jgi:hypothetical protein
MLCVVCTNIHCASGRRNCWWLQPETGIPLAFKTRSAGRNINLPRDRSVLPIRLWGHVHLEVCFALCLRHGIETACQTIGWNVIVKAVCKIVAVCRMKQQGNSCIVIRRTLTPWAERKVYARLYTLRAAVQFGNVQIIFKHRSWRPAGFWDVDDPTLSRQSVHRWRWCQPCAPVALSSPEKKILSATNFY